MSEKYLKDVGGRIIGRMITDNSTGDVRLLDEGGRFKGKWIKHNDYVMNERLQIVGKGIGCLGSLL